jgi:hypothetical protein
MNIVEIIMLSFMAMLIIAGLLSFIVLFYLIFTGKGDDSGDPPDPGTCGLGL